MKRRYLPTLSDHRGRAGAYATEWEGWVNPRGRSYDVSGRRNPTYPTRGDLSGLQDRTGCYAILYDPGGGKLYVAYIGVSRYVKSEVQAKYRDWKIVGDTYFPYTALYIPGVAVATEVESDLIRYYCPPWNVRFS